MSSTTNAEAALAFIRPAVEASKQRRAFCAPEVTEHPDDTFYEWADALLEKMGATTVDLIETATYGDMRALLAFFTDSMWPSHRRAFFNELHSRAQDLERAGLVVASHAFVEFYRQRYQPSYLYIRERTATAPIEVVVHPPATRSLLMTPLAAIQESSQEMVGDEEGSTPVN